MSGRKPTHRWEGRVQVLASLTISGFWHLLVLAVLVMAVHPFQLPMQESPPVELQLLPSLPDRIPQPKPKLRPLQRERAESPRPPPLERARPEDQVLEKPPEIAPPKAQQRTLLDAARPQTDTLDKPVEINRQTVGAQRKLNTTRNAPNLPPAPRDATRPNDPALARATEVQRTAPVRAPALNLRSLPPSIPAEAAPAQPAAVAAPATPAAAQSEAAPQAPGQTQVLTNQQVVQSPVEIRPRERAAAPALSGALPASPDIPLEGGGGAPPPPAGGPGGGGPRTGPNGGVLGGFDMKGVPGGMRMRLGCESPDTYHLTQEERAACLDRMGSLARGTGDLGINISAQNQAAYDHFVDCQDAYHRTPIPGSGKESEGTAIRGMGANPTLKACGPSTR